MEIKTLTTKIEVGEFKPTTIKGMPKYIAIRHYFRYKKVERRQIKLIVTKKRF